MYVGYLLQDQVTFVVRLCKAPALNTIKEKPYKQIID